MNSIAAILTAGALSFATTLLAISLVMLTIGHVPNDRASCMTAAHGAACGLRWEPLP